MSISIIAVVCIFLPRISHQLDIRTCSDSLGLESGRIEDSQLSASSVFDQLSTGPINARIRHETGGGAWCPRSQINASSYEWLQVDLRTPHFISALETQGRWDGGRGREFVTAYMIEYWRDTLGRWSRYRDSRGNEILTGNLDTRTSVFRAFDGGIIARLVRIIPVSESTRTVCLRFELYGCPYREYLVSYSMFDGILYDGLDLRDSTYDGTSISNFNGSNNVWLNEGFGRLFDGVVGSDNFELRPENWIGWRRHRIPNNEVILNFRFESKQNISAISLHSSNFKRLGAKVFQSMRIYFSFNDLLTENIQNNSTLLDGFSPRFFDFDYEPDDNFETARWVRIPIVPNRIASKLHVVLQFADNSQLLLLSEVRFEYGTISSLNIWPINNEDEYRSNISNSLTYFTVTGDEPTSNSVFDTKCFIIGIVILGGIAICTATILVLYCILMAFKYNRQMEHLNDSKIPNFRGFKSFVQVVLNDSVDNSTSSKIAKSQRPSFLKNKILGRRNNFEASKFITSLESSLSTEYAEPNIVENCLARPLLARSVTLAPAYHHSIAMSSSSCHDLMNRSVVSSATGSRYRATPCASAYEGHLLQQQQNSTNLNEIDTINENAYAIGDVDNYSLSDDSIKTLMYNRTFDTNCLPNFKMSAVSFVKSLGVTAINVERRIELCRMDMDRLVAVVTPLDSDQEFYSEMNRLATLRHFNVLHIIGTLSRPNNMPLSYIFEFMPNGDLHQFLLSRGNNSSDEMLISFATQIAAGMSYLESCNFVHGYLMARNCLLNTDGILKISFEELRLAGADESEFCETDKPCDINGNVSRFHMRWMAPESLTTRTVTTQSDVWAFGVTLWEIFSMCSQRPYAQLTDVEVIENGRQISLMHDLNVPMNALAIPTRCSQFFYNEIMLQCWHINPIRRPSFAELHRILQSLALSNIATKILNKC